MRWAYNIISKNMRMSLIYARRFDGEHMRISIRAYVLYVPYMSSPVKLICVYNWIWESVSSHQHQEACRDWFNLSTVGHLTLAHPNDGVMCCIMCYAGSVGYMCIYWFGIGNAAAFWWRLWVISTSSNNTNCVVHNNQVVASSKWISMPNWRVFFVVRNLWCRNTNRIHGDVRIPQNPKQHVNVKFYHCCCCCSVCSLNHIRKWCVNTICMAERYFVEIDTYIIYCVCTAFIR